MATKQQGGVRTDAFSLGEIGQIAVPVREVERAVAFYRDVLGMRLLLQLPTMAFFDCGGVRLMLSLPEGEELERAASIIYYRVPDLQAAVRILGDRGVHFESEPHKVADLGDHELWMAFFRDADENLLALMSEVWC